MKRFALLTMIAMIAGMNVFAADQCPAPGSRASQAEQQKSDKKDEGQSKDQFKKTEKSE